VRGISRSEIVARCVDIYPLLKTELFLRYEEEELPELIDALLAELLRQQLVEARDGGYWVNPGNQMRLLLLAESIQETLQRYAIVLTRMLAQPTSRRSSWKRTA
jgi:glycerol-3-phosphate O-acyltransferase